MKKLNFPILKGNPMPPPVLSMDEYADFVQFYIENLLDRESYEKERAKGRITVPFKLK